MPHQSTISIASGPSALERLDELTDLYLEVYAEPPYNSGPLWHKDAFLNRTHNQAAREGFTLVTADDHDGTLCGFTFGLTIDAGKWWANSLTEPPEQIRAAAKFAVIELVVRRPHRERGLGRTLLTTLLNTRTEPYAILSAMPSAPARDIYEHWGWHHIATSQPNDDAPMLDTMMLQLTPTS
ncbi:GNAT superfamily N-acetyltransferase [Allocatelliglobosispora scoriae]|uniref:GNAT superfamily N-acetyltransferase n=1 Tax=Allocatelliglobosispora scoriae TaxID=643052 RepID=A0A841C679_9ACTN|nr:GNAT family N-acetyltransferase [Allocatelliglobosispora scoriae]MBB5874653.1 GNAT superfamily N-acetyltransferase [Allocatelliglobosispora scoriae]